MPCMLHLMGTSFDPSTAPEFSSLTPIHSYRRGDPNRGSSGFTEVGGLTFEVSPRARMIDLVEHATYYLTKHGALLKKMDGLPNLEFRTLSFYVGPKEFQALESRFTIPSLLIRICAELKLGMGLIVQ